ncbi:universal stress protein [Thiomonas sp. FB-Cd]|uniref:universal stress protein n=1 Tax=Thiomonas sp. FB-Cd TaxID=1158292 RepID=UPI00068FFEE6|nr:universal stress protein [Thiomonas sp. FB-Cd]
MNCYRSVLAYLGETAQERKVFGLAAKLAAGQGADVDAVHPIEAVVAGWMAELARGSGVRAEHHVIDRGPAPLIERARTADLLVIGQPWDAGEGRPSSLHFASQLLIGASCPVLFVPGPEALAENCCSRVLVAWGPGRESARALRDALPLLQRATDVQLRAYGSRQAPAADSLAAASAYLRLHGVNASYAAERMGDIAFNERMMTPTVVDASVADLLLSHATDMAADLIVMGGYSHSRAHELLLGGVTRSILSAMTVPVFMSH